MDGSMSAGPVLLVNPRADFFASKPWLLNRSLYSPLSGLLQIAGMFPRDEHELELVDENVEPIDFRARARLVCISAMTPYADRAYEIADRFRARGIPVLMGGVHATFMPDEALLHADAVCVGEAEPVFERILEDVARGQLRGIYQGNRLCDMKGLARPRWDLIKRERYFLRTFVQVARGCPTGCSFCAEHRVNGSAYRFRPIAEVVEEIREAGDKTVTFNDADLFSTPQSTRALLRALIPLGIKWAASVSCRHLGDEEILELAARSGCTMLSVGFESVNSQSLAGVHKHVNRPDEYARLIEKVHARGIMVNGLFMFGFDHDTEEVFPRTLELVRDCRVDSCGFSTVTPYPGTALFQQLLSEKRITSFRWSRYDQGCIVYRPKLLTARQLWDGLKHMYQGFYSVGSMLRRYPLFGSRSAARWLGLNLFCREGQLCCRPGINKDDPIVRDPSELRFLPRQPLGDECL
jgi:radical SAM superfamily enzyme YgiQ (UPF0313 family)